MAYNDFQGGMFAMPQQRMQRPMYGGGYGGGMGMSGRFQGYGGMQKPAMLGGNTMAQNPMGGMNSRGGYLDNRGVYDQLGGAQGGLDRGGFGGQSMMRTGGNMAWGQPPRQPPGYGPDIGGAGAGGGAVSDPAGVFRPPSFSMGQQNPIQGLGSGMFGPRDPNNPIEQSRQAGQGLWNQMSTPNMDQNPNAGAGATGFTGIPPWGPNTPSPMPADGFGGARVGVPGGPPGSVGPNGQPYTQINTDPNYQQLGTSFGDKGAAEQMLTGLIGQYGRAGGLERYRQFLDNQAMRSDSLGGGGEYAPINLNRGITYR